MIYTRISHQFSLFEYNAMRKTRIPMKRISRERMEQAMREMKKNPRPMLEVLQSINDDLENYEKRLTNK